MAGAVKLDRIDINILARLQQDGKLTKDTVALNVVLLPEGGER